RCRVRVRVRVRAPAPPFTAAQPRSCSCCPRRRLPHHERRQVKQLDGKLDLLRPRRLPDAPGRPAARERAAAQAQEGVHRARDGAARQHLGAEAPQRHPGAVRAAPGAPGAPGRRAGRRGRQLQQRRLLQQQRRQAPAKEDKNQRFAAAGQVKSVRLVAHVSGQVVVVLLLGRHPPADGGGGGAC
ncbi:Transcription initiation factor TFIID subunit 1, partial [Frankliniella fusca]